MSQERTIIENLKTCPRFGTCSINICPLDSEANYRNRLLGEDACPFTIKKRVKDQKGIRLLGPDSVLKVIPESNIKILNRGSLKRWRDLYKRNEKA